MPPRPVLPADPVEIQRRIDEYFAQYEASRDIRPLKSGDLRVRASWPSVIGLCAFLGIGKTAYYSYLDGKYPIPQNHSTKSVSKSDNSADNGVDGEDIAQSIADTLARARDRIEQIILEAAANGDIDSRIAALLMSQWGYSERQEVTTNGEVKVAWQNVNPEDAERYSK